MNLYSLYEFPKNEKELDKIIKYIYNEQPVGYEKLLEVISEAITKTSSRTKITLRTLKKMGIIDGTRLISLSSTTQIYVDLNKSYKDLLIYLVYLKQELFNDCKIVFQINNKASISNIDIIQELERSGYCEKKRTAQEKIYAIKRLIAICQKYKNHDPFSEYEAYISFLVNLQKHYFFLVEGKKNESIPIVRLKRSMLKENISSNCFDDNFLTLYNDPIYSKYTSFTTVINQFANEKYYKILDKKYYYFKLSDFIIK